MSTPVKRQIRRRKLSKRRPANSSVDLGRWSSSSMPELPSYHSRYSSDSLFSWKSWPPRVPTPPLTFDGNDWYADDVFPRPTTLHDKFRYEQASAAFPVETKAPRTTDIRPVERPSLTIPHTYYPRRSSPLTSPPDPPDPEPNVPVPFLPAKNDQAPAKPSNQTELKRSQSTCSRLKKKRRETVDDVNYSTMLAQLQIGALFAKTTPTSEEELGTPNMLLLRRCFVEKYIPPGPKEDGRYPFALLSRLSLVH